VNIAILDAEQVPLPAFIDGASRGRQVEEFRVENHGSARARRDRGAESRVGLDHGRQEARLGVEQEYVSGPVGIPGGQERGPREEVAGEGAHDDASRAHGETLALRDVVGYRFLTLTGESTGA